TGKALLFRRVANVRQIIPVVCKLTTGNHLINLFFTNTFCLSCNTKLDWFCEFTNESAQRFKEGKLII
ncbi:hypothetical protein Angca_009442, partial [Angiostrongylus cantonensis]